MEEKTLTITEDIIPEETFQTKFNKSVIIKGTLWFVLITVLTIAFIFFYNNTGDTLKALSQIKPVYILLCLGMLGIDLMLGSWRNHIFVRKINPSISHWISFRANVANMFMGAVTPAHGGAGPAQIYMYMRNGLDFLSAFTISLINMASTLIFMPLAAFAAILLIDHQFEGTVILNLLKYGFSFFIIFFFVFLLAFWKPTAVGNAIKKIASILSDIFPKRKQKLAGWGEKSYKNIEKYQNTCSVLLKKHPLLFPLSVLITIALYMNKYCMQYVILLGLGIHADIIQVIAVQTLIQFMIYFAPSPGGSGFAEAGISILFSRMVPSYIVPVFTLLQRSFLLFFPAMIGAWFVIGSLKEDAQKSIK